MSERWIQRSKKILNRTRELEETEEKDQLEHVRSIRFMVKALNRSLEGWRALARFFIEYDLKVSKIGAEKGLTARKRLKGEEDKEQKSSISSLG